MAPGRREAGILENKIPFTPSAEGTVSFDIDPSKVDFAPAVAFRERPVH